MKQVLLTLLLMSAYNFNVASGSNWPQFHGLNGSAVVDKGDPPIHFGPSSNVLWKIGIAVGNSSPCTWGNRIFLTTFDKTKLETLCVDRHNGKAFYQDERVGAPGGYYSSAVAANGKIYLASQQGLMLVMAAGETLNVLARNDLESHVMATPAIVDVKIYVRTADHVYAFGK